MKHTDKKNNKPYINASVFFSFIFAAFVLFAVTVSKSTVYGTGDGAGPFIMGSGEGSGTGDGVGDGSLSGNIKGNSSEALKGENPDAENIDNSPGKGDGKGEGEGKGDGAGEGESVPPPQEAETEKGKDNSEQKAGNQQTAVKSSVRKNLPVARLYLAPDKDEEDKKPVKKVKPQKVVKTVEAPAKKVKLSDADGGGGGSRSFSASSGGKSVFRIQKHKNILFIVDISGSMSTLASEGQTRLAILQFQLKRTSREQHRQRSKGKYGIIAFSSPCYYFPDNSKNGQLSFNKVKDIDQTEVWIDSFEKLDRSSTNLFSAIQDGLDRIAKQGLEFDTIFILTDGEPTDVHDPKQYLKLLQDGLPKGISINTISIGTTSQLLKEIAQNYNGVYDEYK